MDSPARSSWLNMKQFKGTMGAAHVLSLGNNWTLDQERKMLDDNAIFTPLIKNLQKPQGMLNLEHIMWSSIRLLLPCRKFLKEEGFM